MDYKIIQIIPVNKEMYAVYKNDVERLIVGLALIEYKNGSRYVVPLDITDRDGIIKPIKGFIKLKIMSQMSYKCLVINKRYKTTLNKVNSIVMAILSYMSCIFLTSLYVVILNLFKMNKLINIYIQGLTRQN